MRTATADDLARLLTAIVRSDRFSEGSINGAFESGLLARIARRAATLLAAEASVAGPEVDLGQAEDPEGL